MKRGRAVRALLSAVVLAVPALLVFATCAPAVRTYLRRAPQAYPTPPQTAATRTNHQVDSNAAHVAVTNAAT